MTMNCPNCSTPLAAGLAECPNCHASFADGSAWAVREGDAPAPSGAAQILSAIAAMLAWVISAGIAVVGSYQEVGSLELFGYYFRRQFAIGGVGFCLASAAIVLGVLVAATSRGKTIAWVGLVGGGAFLGGRFFL